MAFVHGILEGEMPGTFLVDDAGQPRTAIACNDSGFWFALGQPNGELIANSMDALKHAYTAVHDATLSDDTGVGRSPRSGLQGSTHAYGVPLRWPAAR